MSVNLAITMGDPAGIGAEIILKALGETLVTTECKLTVIGSFYILEKTYEQLQGKTDRPLVNPKDLAILDIPLGEKDIIPGKGDKISGSASFMYLQEALVGTLRGSYQGIVTAPIAKSLWKAAGYDYPGQTEVLAAAAGVTRYGMLFVARSPDTGFNLRTLLATTHISLAEVPKRLTRELMAKKLDLLVECLKVDFGIENPKIAISGLNPHSGEGGQLGREEIDWLIPWMETERKNRPEVKLLGPIPPDTLWVKPGQAWFKGLSARENLADCYIALYHDQGLIPVKLMAFDQAINTTIGLPFIRTSPDHGTAFDIAGLGVASPSSLIEAIKLATELVKQRTQEP